MPSACGLSGVCATVVDHAIGGIPYIGRAWNHNHLHGRAAGVAIDPVTGETLTKPPDTQPED